MDKRYQERRLDFEAIFKLSNLQTNERQELISPSGNFQLTIDIYSKGAATWEYSRGLVRRTGDNNVVADIKRNIDHFFHAWVQHSNGSEYLICGEDYQGQTVVNLTKGQKKDFFPESGYNGEGFCWVNAWQSPDSTLLAVEGCYWGCPYEVVFFDFKDPDLLPYKELLRVDDLDNSEGWINNDTFRMTQEVHVRAADKRPYKQLSEKEQDEMDENDELASYEKREVIVTREQILQGID
ncbi:MAG: hypothetical protein G3M70_06415 [Candidatus Nitronauta litoralis]|uniref:Uncharacterized protein n=1 Tax=Candidatus Nitronauta litoralis TaxID=2705533 RepID=A0A7T0BV56_9BACT|nr:MAG: hypothetical protein G3M70_06415 [Candidatus Nitronauta litoralis]